MHLRFYSPRIGCQLAAGAIKLQINASMLNTGQRKLFRATSRNTFEPQKRGIQLLLNARQTRVMRDTPTVPRIFSLIKHVCLKALVPVLS